MFRQYRPAIIAAVLVVAVALVALATVVRFDGTTPEDFDAREGRITAYRLSVAHTNLLEALNRYREDANSGSRDAVALAAQRFAGSIRNLKDNEFLNLAENPENQIALDMLRGINADLDVVVIGASQPDADMLIDKLVTLTPAMQSIAEDVHAANERYYRSLAAESRRTGWYLFLTGFAFLATASVLVAHLWKRSVHLREKTTELEESEKKLRQVSFYRQQFLANMSHEFRTPLNAIQGFTEAILVQKDTIGHEQIVDYVEIVNKASKDLTRLTEDVLDLSKIDAGKLEIYPEEVDFTKLIEDSLIQFAAIAQQRRLSIKTTVAARWLVWCDRLAIKRCLTNVLSNAVKFSEPGGTISVSAYLHEKGFLVVEIQDQGCGIPESELQSIWMVYARSSMSRKNDREGAGLGLAMVKGLMDRHDGFVEIQSREGVGTAVRLCFPADMIVATDTYIPGGEADRRRRARRAADTG